MSALMNIPQEILDGISCSLSACATVSFGLTCRTLSFRLSRALHQHAISSVGDLLAIHWAIQENHLSLLKYLLTYDPRMIQLTQDGRTPLHTAALTPASIDIMQLLLVHGAEVNAIEDDHLSTALHKICCTDRSEPEHVDLLIAHGANINQLDIHGNTPLYLALVFNLDQIAMTLLNHGADTQIADPEGRRPLLYVSAVYNRPAMLSALLAGGADGNYGNHHGSNALLLAAQYGYLESTKVLIDAGMDLDAVDGDMDTAVLLACDYGHPDVAMELISAGAVCNVRNLLGSTPLLSAARQGYLRVVEALLKRGYSIHGDVFRAISAARNAGFEQIVELLEEEVVKRDCFTK